MSVCRIFSWISLSSEGFLIAWGKVWTTDGIFRKTADKLRRRKEAGLYCGYGMLGLSSSGGAFVVFEFANSFMRSRINMQGGLGYAIWLIMRT